MSKTHYRKSPSGAARAQACPASAMQPVEVEPESSSFAKEGDWAHDALERWLVSGEEPEDEELREYLRPLYTHCMRVMGQAAEARVEVTYVSAADPDWGGTADFAALSECREIAWIDDLKYGVGEEVEAKDNAQLLSYAALHLELWPTVETFFLSIWQPRIEGPDNDTWEVTSDAVREWATGYHARLRPENAEVYSAGSWCKWCPVAPTCPELYSIAVKEAKEGFATASDDIEGESKRIDRWLHLLSVEPAIKYAMDAAHKGLYGILSRGGHVPGKKLVMGLGNREYTKPDEEVIEELLAAGASEEEVVVKKVISPAKADKLGLKKVVATMVERPERGLKMVDSSDKRAAAEPPKFDPID